MRVRNLIPASVAVVTAAALAVGAPVPSAAVTPTGFVSPISEVFATADMASGYLFSSVQPTSADAWPYAQFGDYWGVPPAAYPVLPEILVSDALGGYSAVGAIPQLIADAFPALRQLGVNVADYLDTIANAVATAGIALGQGIWNLPAAVITATGEWLSGDVTAALTTLGQAFLGPLTTAGAALRAAGTYVLTGLTTRAAAVLSGLTAPRAYGYAVGGVPLLIAKAVEITAAVVTDLAALNVEGAWNAAVQGLLGPSGLPGMALNITIGAGVQTGPITSSQPTGNELSAAYIPGVRTAVQTNVKIVAAGLAVPNPAPPVPSPVTSPAAATPAVSGLLTNTGVGKPRRSADRAPRVCRCRVLA